MWELADDYKEMVYNMWELADDYQREETEHFYGI